MYTSESFKRVTYAETDKMGYLYYGRYPEYFEIGRVEMLRQVGIRYRDMEDEWGVMLPVTHLEVKYIRPAYYDDVLRVVSSMAQLPEKNMRIDVEVFNEKNELLTVGKVSLAFVDAKTGRRCPTPQAFLDKMRPFFDEQ